LAEGIVVEVHVIPKASSSEIVGWEGDTLKIRIAAVPDKGKANKELIRFLAKKLKIAKSQISLLKGEKSRHKKLQIIGISSLPL